MQDTDPLPWGAQDRFQTHFIVRKDIGTNISDYLTQTKLTTSGHFGAKKLVSVSWTGGRLASVLNEDLALNQMLLGLSVNDAHITVEPTDGAIRIHSKWQNSYDLGISKETFAIYDKIAGHIKNL